MKRIFKGFLIVILLAVGLSGCGGNGGTKETENKDSGQAGTRLSEAYAKMMNDGKYLMEVVTTTEVDGVAMRIEMTMAVDGDDVAITTVNGGVTSSMISKGDKLYVIDEASKTVLVMKQSVGELSEAAKTSEVSGLNFTKSGQEGGLQYEEYTTDGGKILYYFEGANLKKIKYVAEDGSVSEMEIIRMTKDIPAGTFEVPADYQLIEM